ncbi:Uncharacterised protein [Mycobacteroides abscessus subsp. abscessus]|nr:Uncharacterised protein [Mycobacteroides abscessus subsp. abscessus]
MLAPVWFRTCETSSASCWVDTSTSPKPRRPIFSPIDPMRPWNPVWPYSKVKAFMPASCRLVVIASQYF